MGFTEDEIEIIRNKYCSLGESQSTIAKFFDVATTRIEYQIRKSKMKKYYKIKRFNKEEKAEIKRLRVVDGLSISEIAKMYNRSASTISYICSTKKAGGKKKKKELKGPVEKRMVKCKCLRCDTRYEVESDSFIGRLWYRDHTQHGETCPKQREIQIPILTYLGS